MSGGFNNPIVGGGGALVYPSIHSPDYVPGVSGWSINKDGSAEFDDLTIRGTFEGTDFEISSAGIFIYSGTPAAGNLIASIASAAGSDRFGNAYVQGIGSYGNPLAGPAYSQMLQGIFGTGLFSDTTPASLTGGQGMATLSSGQQSILDTAIGLRLHGLSEGNYANLIGGALGLYQTPDTPSLGASGFKTMALVHGWANSGSGPAAQYRLVASPPNSVEIIGDIVSGTQADGTVIATLPGNYSPLNNQPFPCAFPGNTNNEPAPRFSVNPSGQLQCNGIAGMPAGQRVSFHWFISLDA